MSTSDGAAGPRYEYADTPEPGGTAEIQPGLHWFRMPLPFALAHINLWLLEDDDGYVPVDSGVHTPDATAWWQAVHAGVMGSRAVRRVIITHLHPDHAGNAGWLAKTHDAELLMTRQEYLLCRLLMADTDRPPPEPGLDFYRAAGFPASALHNYEKMFGMFGRLMSPLPEAFRRIADGDCLDIGGDEWQVKVGSGHSPEHACLYSATRNTLIAGDQILPTISSNVSVFPTEPEADPLADWLASIDRFRAELPQDVLVLPAHGRPFRGVHARLDALRSEHEEGLDKLYAHCREPRRVFDVFPALFRSEIRDQNLMMATGESIAHLNWLWHRGKIARETDSAGVHWYRQS